MGRLPGVTVFPDLRPSSELRHAVLPATAASVPLARRTAVAWAAELGAGAPTREAIALCVSEAAANVVQYAYGDDAAQRTFVLEVEAAHDDAALVVRIVDHGVGLAANRPSVGIGRGLVLMERLADRLTVVSSSAGTRVELRFGLKRPAGP